MISILQSNLPWRLESQSDRFYVTKINRFLGGFPVQKYRGLLLEGALCLLIWSRTVTSGRTGYHHMLVTHHQTKKIGTQNGK